MTLQAHPRLMLTSTGSGYNSRYNGILPPEVITFKYNRKIKQPLSLVITKLYSL